MSDADLGCMGPPGMGVKFATARGHPIKSRGLVRSEG